MGLIFIGLAIITRLSVKIKLSKVIAEIWGGRNTATSKSDEARDIKLLSNLKFK